MALLLNLQFDFQYFNLRLFQLSLRQYNFRFLLRHVYCRLVLRIGASILLRLVRSVLVPLNANYNLIEPTLSFRRNLLHYCISNLWLLLQNLPGQDFDEYSPKFYQTVPDLFISVGLLCGCQSAIAIGMPAFIITIFLSGFLHHPDNPLLPALLIIIFDCCF